MVVGFQSLLIIFVPAVSLHSELPLRAAIVFSSVGLHMHAFRICFSSEHDASSPATHIRRTVRDRRPSLHSAAVFAKRQRIAL